jgi:hypothetical protein
MDKTKDEEFATGIEELVAEGAIRALCPNCRLPLESMKVKKCEFCKKKIKKDEIIIKALPEKLD